MSYADFHGVLADVRSDPCATGATGASADARGSTRRRRGVASRARAVHRLQEEVLEVERLEPLRLGARLRIDELQFVAARSTSGASAFGLTQIQSMPAGGGERAVGLDGDAEARARAARRSAARRAAAAARRRCTRRSAGAARRVGPARRDRIRQRRRPSRTCRRPGRRCRRNRCRRNRQTAPARSSSRPDHRLQPAKRRNTAGVPAFAPSPCSV